MNRRRESRKKRRLTCSFRVNGVLLRGIVIDLSPSGLFVQVTSSVPPNTEVTLQFPDRGGVPSFEVNARVARRRVVPRQLQTLFPSGIGLEVIDPPEAFTRLVAGETAQESSGAKPAAPTRAGQKYRARIAQCDGPRSRTRVVEAESEESARDQVEGFLPSGWEILEITKL